VASRYGDGLGVERDESRPRTWWQRAMAGGFTTAAATGLWARQLASGDWDLARPSTALARPWAGSGRSNSFPRDNSLPPGSIPFHVRHFCRLIEKRGGQG